jgi:hypothetical protein
MAKFQKKPIVVEATQWFKDGDHTSVSMWRSTSLSCDECSRPLREHGWVETLEGGHRVCPGDWIITGIRGEHYPVKNDIFLETYEKVLED